MIKNTWRRRSLAVLAVVCLSVPSAVGVHHALAPTRGAVAAWLAAVGFELVYLSTAVLVLTSDLRRYAQRVALAAVVTAVTLNALADYAMRVPGGLASWRSFAATFDGLALGLSVIESLPLAALAYAVAVLLHRLAEAEAEADAPAPEPAPAAPVILTDLALPRQAEFPDPVPVQVMEKTCKASYACPRCGATLSLGQYGSAKRRGYCRNCKPEVVQ